MRLAHVNITGVAMLSPFILSPIYHQNKISSFDVKKKLTNKHIGLNFFINELFRILFDTVIL